MHACRLRAAWGQDAPPPAPSAPVTDVHHGVPVPDPYRNLENLADPATRAWLQAQGQFAAAKLARIDVRDAMGRRLEELNRTTGDNVRAIRRMPGGRVYYLTRKVGEPQFKLALREPLDGAERILVDPQELARATGVPHAINHYAQSSNASTLAYGISSGGSENASLYLLDVATGRALGKPIPRVVETPHWAPDSRHLAYNQLRDLGGDAPETERYLVATVFLLAQSNRTRRRARSSDRWSTSRWRLTGSTSLRSSFRPTARGWSRVPPTPPPPKARSSSRP